MEKFFTERFSQVSYIKPEGFPALIYSFIVYQKNNPSSFIKVKLPI